MNRLPHWLYLSGILLGFGAAPLQGQDTPQASAALVPLIGAGGFPRPRDVESGATVATQLLLGAALEFSHRSGLALVSLVRGFQPFACAGGCARDGVAAEATALMHVMRAHNEHAALSIGPAVGYCTFDGQRGTFGIAASAGATRGFGPRFLFRYAVLSGTGSARSLVGWFGVRLGS